MGDCWGNSIGFNTVVFNHLRPNVHLPVNEHFSGVRLAAEHPVATEAEVPTLLREVVVMGGTIAEPGNVSPVAEANIWNDPHAADRVFTAGWKLTMVGLDVTHRVVLLLSLFKQIADKHRHPATDTLHSAVGFYAKFYSGLYRHIADTPGCFAHDLLAFIYLVNPALFGIDTKVVLIDGKQLAKLMIDFDVGVSVAASYIVKRVDSDYFEEL